MVADGPVPAVDAVLAVTCVVELGAIGFRLYRTAREAESLAGQSMASRNADLDKRLQGEERVIEEHFDRLEGRDHSHGSPNDPQNRADWKGDIARHIRQMEEYTDRVNGRRNQAPWREKVQQYKERLENTQ